MYCRIFLPITPPAPTLVTHAELFKEIFSLLSYQRTRVGVVKIHEPSPLHRAYFYVPSAPPPLLVGTCPAQCNARPHYPEDWPLCRLCLYCIFKFGFEFEFEGHWFYSGGLKIQICGCEKDGGSPWAAPRAAPLAPLPTPAPPPAPLPRRSHERSPGSRRGLPLGRAAVLRAPRCRERSICSP